MKLPAEQFNLNEYFVQIKARRNSAVLSIRGTVRTYKVKHRGADGWSKTTGTIAGNLALPSHSTSTEKLPVTFC